MSIPNHTVQEVWQAVAEMEAAALKDYDEEEDCGCEQERCPCCHQIVPAQPRATS